MWTLAWGCTWSFSEKPEKFLTIPDLCRCNSAASSVCAELPNRRLNSLLRWHGIMCLPLDTASAVPFLFWTNYWWGSNQKLSLSLFQFPSFSTRVFILCPAKITEQSSLIGKVVWQHIYKQSERTYIALFPLQAFNWYSYWGVHLKKKNKQNQTNLTWALLENPIEIYIFICRNVILSL